MHREEDNISIAIDRVSNHFSASHALISNRYCEGLHGHNYFVDVEIEGIKDRDEILIDFIFLDNLLKEITSKFDHYVLIPSQNNLLKITRSSDNLELRYGDRYYSIPEKEIKLLECTNITAESLAGLLGEELYKHLKEKEFWSRINQIRLSVWETEYYKATYTIFSNDSRTQKI
ncbi:MAG: 6-pyruvoyl tetrahydropterin synthase family protein [Candidatus Hodarchaeota archaeon]